MDSKKRALAALRHEEPNRIPIDFGGTATTDSRVSCVAAFRERYGLERRLAKVHGPYQMLGWTDRDLEEAMRIDVEGLSPPKAMFGFPSERWKSWRLPSGLGALVSECFRTTVSEEGDVSIYREGDLSAPSGGRMPRTGWFLDTVRSPSKRTGSNRETTWKSPGRPRMRSRAFPARRRGRPGDQVRGDRCVGWYRVGGHRPRLGALPEAAQCGAALENVCAAAGDGFGETLRRSLAEAGGDTARVLVTEKEPTGVALIFVQKGGQNMIAVAPGADARVTPKDTEALGDFFRPGGLLLLQLETPMATVEAAAALSTTKLGAQAPIPTRADADAFASKG
ncbi:MAG: PfkB family carbohydrate kinase [Planctomycetota bacterium]